MLAEISPAIALPSSQRDAKERGALAWRLVIPLIGGVSAGLWMLVGKGITLLIH